MSIFLVIKSGHDREKAVLAVNDLATAEMVAKVIRRRHRRYLRHGSVRPIFFQFKRDGQLCHDPTIWSEMPRVTVREVQFSHFTK